MKRHFLILTTTITTVFFISCSKEQIQAPVTDQQVEEVTGINKPGFVINPLNVGLIGRFEFNSNLKDTTGQLPTWTSTHDRVLYTTDRKGQANKAVRFNEAYGLYMLGVPVDSNMSVSVWVKNDIFPLLAQVPFVEIARGITFTQLENTYRAFSWNGVAAQYVFSGAIDNKWHHLAATRDATSLKFYIDGTLIGTAPTPAGFDPIEPLTDYGIGYGFNAVYKYWKGSMDDLRIYKRVITPVEVNKLANL